MELIVQPDGNVRCVYDETLELGSIGCLTISRASHVEPNPHGGWLADLSPVGGPSLGPFPRRSEALTAELDWLAAHWLVKQGCG